MANVTANLNERYQTADNASLYNFKTNVNKFLEELSYFENKNLILNPNFAVYNVADNSMTRWIQNSINSFAYDNVHKWMTVDFAAGGNLVQNIAERLEKNTSYTVILYLKAAPNTVTARIEAANADQVYNLKDATEVNKASATAIGTDTEIQKYMIQFKTNATAINGAIQLKIYGDSTVANIKYVLLYKGLTEVAGVPDGQYSNVFNDSIRYNVDMQRWEVTDDWVTWYALAVSGVTYNIMGGAGGGAGDALMEDISYEFLLDRLPYDNCYYDIFSKTSSASQGIDTLLITSTLGSGDWLADDTSLVGGADEYIVVKPVSLSSTTYYKFLPYIDCEKVNGETSNSLFDITYSTTSATGGFSAKISNGTSVSVSGGFTNLYIKIKWNSPAAGKKLYSYGVFYNEDYQTYTTDTRTWQVETLPTAWSANSNKTLPNGMVYTRDNKSLEVYRNGQRLLQGIDFVEVNNRTIKFLIDLNAADVMLYTEKIGYVDSSTANQTRMDNIAADHALLSSQITGMINDSTTSLNSTWSSTKIGSILHDTNVDTVSTWSSYKINSQISGLIADTSTAPNKVWSAYKVNQIVLSYTSSATSAIIDDSVTLPTKTWSSNKITSQIAALLNDSVTASNTTWSSNKINSQIASAAPYKVGYFSINASAFPQMQYDYNFTNRNIISAVACLDLHDGTYNVTNNNVHYVKIYNHPNGINSTISIVTNENSYYNVIYLYT